MKLPAPLTQREEQILPLLVSGATRVEIARHLGISAETVKIHTKKIVDKFDAANLRDGLSDMTQYQAFYGAGGSGMDRFQRSVEVCVHVVDPTQHMTLVFKNSIVVMAERLDMLSCFSLAHQWDTRVEVDGTEIQPTATRANQMIYDFAPRQILKKGDAYEYEVKMDMTARSGSTLTDHIQYLYYPSQFRSFELTWPEDVTLSQYGYEVLSGLHVYPNYPVQVETSERSVKYLDYAPVTPIEFRLWWSGSKRKFSEAA